MADPFAPAWPFRTLRGMPETIVYRRPVQEGPERACLAIADVSGYTGYLAGVELDHAQDILADLIGTVVNSMAPFELSKLEGDAAFMSLSGTTVDGSALQDAVEGTYVAFQRRLRDIQQASSCECDACVRIPSLDLKFVIHHGSIARQRMVGMEELVGSDVILVHRLLKNAVTSATGVAAYALYTDAVVEAASLDPAAQGLTSHKETTDVSGEMTTWIRDLGAIWQVETDREPRMLTAEELLDEYVWEAPTPPSVTFDWLTAPAKRVLWNTGISDFTEDADAGRRGVGTTNHCLHGEAAIKEFVLEYRPPHYWLLRGFMESAEMQLGVYVSDELIELPGGGTRVINRTGRLEDETTPPEMLAMAIEMFGQEQRATFMSLRRMLTDLAAKAAPDSQPPLQSAGRHLSEPVVAS